MFLLDICNFAFPVISGSLEFTYLEKLSFNTVIKQNLTFTTSSSPAGDKYEHQWEALAGWFLGPRAENRYVLNDLMSKALNWHADRREEFFPSDPSYFTEKIKNSVAAKSEYEYMEKQMKRMHDQLNRSIPFFSTRYQVRLM